MRISFNIENKFLYFFKYKHNKLELIKHFRFKNKFQLKNLNKDKVNFQQKPNYFTSHLITKLINLTNYYAHLYFKTN